MVSVFTSTANLIFSCHLQTVALSAPPPPNILVSTPACVAACISKGIIRGSSIKESLSVMILDEVHFINLL
jgi:ATP-dependent RNA helicase DDX56/DBP9